MNGAPVDLADRCHASGKYTFQCIGPRTEEEGQRIVAYLREHPEMYDLPYPNIEAAEILGIPLREKWVDEQLNTVVTVGKNLALDTYLAGAAYTVTGPFMGLISGNSFFSGGILAADTMASHANWAEAGSGTAPLYTSPRKTAAWNSASAGSKALSAALSFAIQSTGTVKGAFLVFGAGAVSQIDNTAGTLYSAGLFGTGDRAVLSGDTLNVSYSTSL